MKGFVVYPTYRIEKIADNTSSEGKEKKVAVVYLYGMLENGESFLIKHQDRPYFYIAQKDVKKAEKLAPFQHEKSDFTNFYGELVEKVTVGVPAMVPELRRTLEQKNIPCYEADIRFSYRYLIDHGLKGGIDLEGDFEKGEGVDRVYDTIKGKVSVKPVQGYTPKLKVLSFDIETDMKASNVYCISLYTEKYEKVFIVSDQKLKHAENCKDEKELLEKFAEQVRTLDPDVITGWNVIDFDLAVLRKRFRHHNIPLQLGRSKEEGKVTVYHDFFRESKADFPGRIVLDGIHLLKNAYVKLPDYTLNTAARHFLKKEKLLQGAGRHDDIQILYNKGKGQDHQKLVDYNLLDAKLVYDILETSKVLDLAVERSLLTGMQLDRVSASIASLDNVYLGELRKQKIVANTSRHEETTERIKGGYVRESTPGIYEYILVLDFKSLYPSIIRTFNIDPLQFIDDVKEKELSKKDRGDKKKIIHAPNGALFSQQEGILPNLIEHLWNKRDKAKKENNKLASNAIKLLMNSFFGVLANSRCRFYSLSMANAITHFGQHIIKTTADNIEGMGYKVIYGDTDSIFVQSKAKKLSEAEKIGKKLQDAINTFYDNYTQEEYARKNFLELEFEKTYLKFLMPRVRGAKTGAKKRYAGILLKDGKEVMDFVGLEFVRRDWTELAKKFQLEFLQRVFKGEDVVQYVQKFLKDLKAGKHDDLLVYRKAIRKDVDEYTKTTPPHVKAARKLDKIESSLIEYYITKNGPEPLQKHKSRIDYDHYIDKQIKPLADAVLCFYDKEFDDLLKGNKQMGLGDF
jgi:DNA polymerase II